MVTLVLGIYSPQSNTLYPITMETMYQCDLKQSFHGNVVYDITSVCAGTTTSHISDTHGIHARGSKVGALSR